MGPNSVLGEVWLKKIKFQGGFGARDNNLGNYFYKRGFAAGFFPMSDSWVFFFSLQGTQNPFLLRFSSEQSFDK